MINTVIIGFSGLAGAGKDEAAKVTQSILEQQGIPSQRYSFAFPLKEVAKFVFEITDEEMSDRVLKEQTGRNTYGLTNRRTLQLLGTESFRDVFDSNIWIDVAERLISRSGVEVCVISDVRFENEAQWVKQNGILIHIDPTGREGFETTSESHSSEAGYETAPDHVIENIGTLEEFHSQVQNVVMKYALPMYQSIAKEVSDLMLELNDKVQDIKKRHVGEKNGE